MEDVNMFEETVVSAAIPDEDFDVADGPSGPMYRINFGKEYTRVLLDQSLKAEIPNSKMREAYRARDYKTVVQMMTDLKSMTLSDWQVKYFED